MRIRLAAIADVPALARVHVDSWRTTYKGIVPDDYLTNLSSERRERLWHAVISASGSLVFVAEAADGNIVGFAAGGRERSGDPVYSGELYAIYLLDSWQRRGIGRQLTMALVKRLIEAELTSLLVWVLAKNPSRRFYEALGGRQVREKVETTGGVQLIEVAYGWLDARAMVEGQG